MTAWLETGFRHRKEGKKRKKPRRWIPGRFVMPRFRSLPLCLSLLPLYLLAGSDSLTSAAIQSWAESLGGKVHLGFAFGLLKTSAFGH